MDDLFDRVKEEAHAIVTAKRLTDMGYRRISRRHNLLARTDRDDWREYMSKELCWPSTPVPDEPQWRDHYLRCFSKDRLSVPRKVSELVPKEN